MAHTRGIHHCHQGDRPILGKGQVDGNCLRRDRGLGVHSGSKAYLRRHRGDGCKPVLQGGDCGILTQLHRVFLHLEKENHTESETDPQTAGIPQSGAAQSGGDEAQVRHLRKNG